MPAAAGAPGTLGRRYLAFVLLPLALGLLWLHLAPEPPSAADLVPAAASSAPVGQPSLPQFLLQLLLILLAAKLAGAAARRLGQPSVIGEILAGIALGPSLLGLLLPDAQQALFPEASLPPLTMLGQLGVLVFMFCAGAEFEPGRFRGRRRQALLISHAGIALPMLLGCVLAWPLFPLFAPQGVGPTHFALFLGAALSITAFPVLLRIIDARGYQQRPVAELGIACAAISDATAWAMLAAIVASVHSRGLGPLALQLCLLAAASWLLLAPLRRRLETLELSEHSASTAMIALIIGALGCALLTELIGLHLVFGAFIAGVSVSSSQQLRRLVDERIRPFAAVILLPVFFASAGLGLHFGALRADDWLWGVVLVLAASVGKGGATVLVARWTGVPAVDSWRLGALMNTRGLMELVVLAVGHELGLIDDRLYALLVLVAIVTTLATGPLLGLIDRVQNTRWGSGPPLQ